MYFEGIKNIDFINKKEAEKLANDFYKTGRNLTLYWRALSFSIWYNNFYK
jgi:hypothetical protein